jgi:hypothetical protein
MEELKINVGFKILTYVATRPQETIMSGTNIDGLRTFNTRFEGISKKA